MSEAAASHPAAETLCGRGLVHVVPVPERDERWVVRHYQRGGAVASLLGDRYLRVGTPRPFRELRVGRALEELDVPTVPHLGAAVYRSGLWYRGDLVTRYVPDSRDLAAVLFPAATLDRGPAAEDRAEPPRGTPTEPSPAGSPDAGPDPGAAMAAAGALIRLLHDRGVRHPDLNLKNVLVVGRGASLRALVLDLDRASLGAAVGERARRRMLDRFWRSARKWEAATARPLAASLRAAFEAGYRRSNIDDRTGP